MGKNNIQNLLINDVAKIADCHQQTVRNYEKRGSTQSISAVLHVRFWVLYGWSPGAVHTQKVLLCQGVSS